VSSCGRWVRLSRSVYPLPLGRQGQHGPTAAGDECGQERELTDPGGRLGYFLKKSAVVPSATAANNHEAGAVSTNAAVAGRVAPNAK
jgi:hypothetical protein